jgi:hypothetical protein
LADLDVGVLVSPRHAEDFSLSVVTPNGRVPERVETALEVLQEELNSSFSKQHFEIAPNGRCAIAWPAVKTDPVDTATDLRRDASVRIWANWTEPREVRELEDYKSARIVGTHHARLTGDGAPLLVDLREPSRSLALPPEVLEVSVLNDGYWAGHLWRGHLLVGKLEEDGSVQAPVVVSDEPLLDETLAIRAAPLHGFFVLTRESGEQMLILPQAKTVVRLSGDYIVGEEIGDDQFLVRHYNEPKGFFFGDVDSAGAVSVGRLWTDMPVRVHHIAPAGNYAVCIHDRRPLGGFDWLICPLNEALAEKNVMQLDGQPLGWLGW